MKQGNNSIEFDVKEALYFETGQEIDEMLAISLDPDIAIQTYEEYIQIRGIVLLQGEYKRAAMIPNRSVAPTENEFTKYIEKVYDMDEERSRFSHRFPVEISVPTHLVDNLEDITVSVDAFDYDLPDQNKLNINASVHIHGINNEVEQNERAEETAEEMSTVERTSGMDEETSAQMNNEESNDQEVESTELRLVEDRAVEQEEMDMNREQAVEDEAAEQINVTENIEPEQFEEIEEFGEIDIQLNESPSDEENETVKDVQFLTDLFGGEQEETSTKMRIYITQEDDSIESIAKKYEISSLQLMKDNEISADELEAGQLLYLPVKKEEQ